VNKHIGSSFEDFLEEVGISEEIDRAQDRIKQLEKELNEYRNSNKN